MYELHLQQDFRIDVDEIWQFITNPTNLEEITPSYMNFKITSEVPAEMYEGLIIEYKVKLPVLGVTDWIIHIKNVVPGRQFVSEQRTGPFSFWQHHHELEKTGKGSRMTDKIHYRLPYGQIGMLANNLFFGKRLYAIFRYRNDMLGLKFGN